MAKQQHTHKTVIGRTELVTFVRLGDTQVPAKIDSGAYHSSVHATDIVVKGDELHCTLFGKHPIGKYMKFSFSTKNFRQTSIKNSFGQSELRYEVPIRIKIGPKVITTPFTLADRSNNTYPVLIGRKVLNNRFVIDTSLTTVSRAELKRKYGVEFPQEQTEDIL